MRAIVITTREDHPGRLLAVATGPADRIAACSPGNPPIEFNHCVTRYIGTREGRAGELVLTDLQYLLFQREADAPAHDDGRRDIGPCRHERR